MTKKMNPKTKSPWFKWLSPGSLSPKSDKEAQVHFGTSYNTPCQEVGENDQPCQNQLLSLHREEMTGVAPHQQIKKGCEKRRASVPHGSPIFPFLREVTVEPIVFLHMLAIFAQYASFQDLIYTRTCSQNFPSEVCDNLHNATFHKEEAMVHRETSYLILMATLSLGIPSLFIAVYLGSWSDRFGRKWPILFPPMGGVLACIVYIVLAFQPDIPIQWVCLASFLSGLFGGFFGLIMSCMSYVSAISSEKNRTVRISRLEAMTFLGGTIGPFLSGSLLQHIGHGLSFAFMLGCYALAFLYALFCVKEVKDGVTSSQDSISPNQSRTTSAMSSSSVVTDSVKSSTLGHRTGEGDIKSVQNLLSPKKNNSSDEYIRVPTSEEVFVNTDTHDPFNTPSPYQPLSSNHSGNSQFEDTSSTATSEDERRDIFRKLQVTPEPKEMSCCSRYFGADHFVGALKTIVERREEGRRLYLILTLVAGYIVMVVTAGELDVAYLFAKGEPLKWSHQTFSYYFGVKFGLGTLALLLGGPILQRLQVQDSTVCILGIFSRMIGLIVYALSPSTLITFLAPLLGVFSFFSIPATRSLLSKLVTSDEQGKIFAFVAIMEDICTMTASMMFNSLYPLTRPIHKGFIFLLAACLLIIPVVIMRFVGHRLVNLGVVVSTKPRMKENSCQNKISNNDALLNNA